MATLKVHNLDRLHCMPHIPESIEHDHGQVVDYDQMSRNPITRKNQPKVVFSGSMPDCIAWMKRNTGEDLMIDTTTGRVVDEGDIWAADQDLVW